MKAETVAALREIAAGRTPNIAPQALPRTVYRVLVRTKPGGSAQPLINAARKALNRIPK